MIRVGDLLPRTLADLLPDETTARRANWIEVARVDVAKARRSPLLWGLCGLFPVLPLLFLSYLLVFVAPPDADFPFRIAVMVTSYITQLFVPLIGLVVGATAVVGERETGSLRVFLGLPITRRDVVTGKLLGRVLVCSALLLIGLTLVGAAVWYLCVGFDLWAYAVFVAVTLLLGSIFAGIGVGLSTLFRSRARAIGASAGVYALVKFVWYVIPAGVFYYLNGQYPESTLGPGPWDPPAWYVFLGNGNPVNGYFVFVAEWVRGVDTIHRYPHTREYWEFFTGDAGPFYVQPEFLLVVMVLWVLVPLALGGWRFGRSDLG